MIRILLTGFTPFDDATINPSQEAALALAAAPPEGCALRAAVLPVSYAAAAPALAAALTAAPTDILIATGLAGGRAAISVERVAINVDDARLPDNDGVRRIDAPVVPGGPAAYFATVPIKAMTAAIREAGVPAEVSQTAGTFLCNHIFYRACHLAATAYPGLRVGFLHLPYLPEQVAGRPGVPSMGRATLLRGLAAAICAARDHAADLAVAEGSAA
ncbi:MAG: pyroglutamyl-peptidase I [Alphaproteobacteria bacterium]|nr:pyroglutamyl-peptidase I [Alphaproteobacteria bacterium]